MRARCWQYESQFIAAGVHGLATSASPETMIEPPGTGFSPATVVGAATTVVAGVVPAAVVALDPAVVVAPPAVVAAPAAVVAAPAVVADPAVVAGAFVSLELSSFLLHAAAISPRLSVAATTHRPVARPVRCLVRISQLPP